MSLGHMPMAQSAGLVVIETEVNAKRHAVDARREMKVGRRRVGRIAAEDNENIDDARVHLIDQIAQRTSGRLDRRGPGVDDRAADVAEEIIDGVCQGMNGGRLSWARDDEAGAAMLPEVARQRVEPSTFPRKPAPYGARLAVGSPLANCQMNNQCQNTPARTAT